MEKFLHRCSATPSSLPNRLFRFGRYRAKGLHLLDILVLFLDDLAAPPAYGRDTPTGTYAAIPFPSCGRATSTATAASAGVGTDGECGPAERGFLPLGEDKAGGEGLVVGGWVRGGADETDVGREGSDGWGGGEDFDGGVR